MVDHSPTNDVKRSGLLQVLGHSLLDWRKLMNPLQLLWHLELLGTGLS